ncbi:hypothetical protein Q2941_26035 [Bradyrhizobium sp. UFLA05-153]
MEHGGIEFFLVQSLSPKGWKWIVRLGDIEKLGSTEVDRQSAIGRAKQFIDDFIAKRKLSEVPDPPSIVPQDADHNMYVVLDVFGIWSGCAWHEVDEEDTRETLINDLLNEQYRYPVRIVAFNTAEGWSRSVTMEVATELLRRYAAGGDVPHSLQHLLEMVGHR